MTDIDVALTTGTYSRHNAIMPKSPRRRKCAMDHHGNGTMYDINGNDSLSRRIEVLSENYSQHVQRPLEESPTLNNDDQLNENNVKDESEPGWQGAFLDQIQSLLQNAQITDSLTRCIDEETTDNINQNPPHVPRVRRKSCFTLGPVGQVGYYNTLYRNVTTANKLSGTCKDRLSTEQTGRRRKSCASIENTVPALSNGRRRSVAHAPLSSNSFPVRRMSCTNENLIPANHQRQRRKSSAKPFTFAVAKISKVQIRLHRIYRQRRRKERASVNIDDVKSAISGPNGNNCNPDDSDSSGNVSSGNEVVDENSNIQELDANESRNDVDSAQGPDSVDNSATDNVVENVDETPVPRRRCSVQVRAWELSRKLRQKRREKRKGFTESPLI